jgi:PPOX class probable F420-dependent enzyme
MTSEQREYLGKSGLCVFATGRRDGSPQVSTLNYTVQDDKLVLSVKHDRAKWKNAKRQPRVALVHNKGRRQLIVYGTAECIEEDPMRVRVARRHREILGRPAPDDDAGLIAELDADNRVMMRITPDRIFMND